MSRRRQGKGLEGNEEKIVVRESLRNNPNVHFITPKVVPDKPALKPTTTLKLPTDLKCPAMKEAIHLVGKARLARALGVKYQSMDMWPIRGMPRTEWTGETEYWRVIEEATGGQITKDMLLRREA